MREAEHEWLPSLEQSTVVATILWNFAVSGFVLNAALLYRYLKTSWKPLHQNPPPALVASQCVTNLIMVVCILLATMTLTVDMGDTGVMVGRAHLFLSVMAMVNSWLVQVRMAICSSQKLQMNYQEEKNEGLERGDRVFQTDRGIKEKRQERWFAPQNQAQLFPFRKLRPFHQGRRRLLRPCQRMECITQRHLDQGRQQALYTTHQEMGDQRSCYVEGSLSGRNRQADVNQNQLQEEPTSEQEKRPVSQMTQTKSSETMQRTGNQECAAFVQKIRKLQVQDQKPAWRTPPSITYSSRDIFSQISGAKLSRITSRNTRLNRKSPASTARKRKKGDPESTYRMVTNVESRCWIFSIFVAFALFAATRSTRDVCITLDPFQRSYVISGDYDISEVIVHENPLQKVLFAVLVGVVYLAGLVFNIKSAVLHYCCSDPDEGKNDLLAIDQTGNSKGVGSKQHRSATNGKMPFLHRLGYQMQQQSSDSAADIHLPLQHRCHDGKCSLCNDSNVNAVPEKGSINKTHGFTTDISGQAPGQFKPKRMVRFLVSSGNNHRILSRFGEEGYSDGTSGVLPCANDDGKPTLAEEGESAGDAPEVVVNAATASNLHDKEHMEQTNDKDNYQHNKEGYPDDTTDAFGMKLGFDNSMDLSLFDTDEYFIHFNDDELDLDSYIDEELFVEYPEELWPQDIQWTKVSPEPSEELSVKVVGDDKDRNLETGGDKTEDNKASDMEKQVPLAVFDEDEPTESNYDGRHLDSDSDRFKSTTVSSSSAPSVSVSNAPEASEKRIPTHGAIAQTFSNLKERFFNFGDVSARVKHYERISAESEKERKTPLKAYPTTKEKITQNTTHSPSKSPDRPNRKVPQLETKEKTKEKFLQNTTDSTLKSPTSPSAEDPQQKIEGNKEMAPNKVSLSPVPPWYNGAAGDTGEIQVDANNSAKSRARPLAEATNQTKALNGVDGKEVAKEPNCADGDGLRDPSTAYDCVDYSEKNVEGQPMPEPQQQPHPYSGHFQLYPQGYRRQKLLQLVPTLSQHLKVTRPHAQGSMRARYARSRLSGKTVKCAEYNPAIAFELEEIRRLAQMQGKWDSTIQHVFPGLQEHKITTQQLLTKHEDEKHPPADATPCILSENEASQKREEGNGSKTSNSGNTEAVCKKDKSLQNLKTGSGSDFPLKEDPGVLKNVALASTMDGGRESPNRSFLAFNVKSPLNLPTSAINRATSTVQQNMSHLKECICKTQRSNQGIGDIAVPYTEYYASRWRPPHLCSLLPVESSRQELGTGDQPCGDNVKIWSERPAHNFNITSTGFGEKSTTSSNVFQEKLRVSSPKNGRVGSLLKKQPHKKKSGCSFWCSLSFGLKCFMGFVLHCVVCMPFGLSLAPWVFQGMDCEIRFFILLVARILFFFHVVVSPAWLLCFHLRQIVSKYKH